MTLSPDLIRLLASLAIAAPMVALACFVLSRVEKGNPNGRS